MGKVKQPIRGEQLALLDVPTTSDQDKFRGQNKPEVQQTRTLNLDDLIRAADRLPDADLRHLQAAIAVMLEIRGVGENDEAQIAQSHSRSSGGQRGSIEEKRINGCGPYRYLRWWSGGKHRSTYLGKAKGYES